MAFDIRKWHVVVDEIHHEGGAPALVPPAQGRYCGDLRKPYLGAFSTDLDELVEDSGDLAEELVRRCVHALEGREPESCGKGAVVGTAGEQENGVACPTTPFGDALRKGIHGSTWVMSEHEGRSTITAVRALP